MKRPATIDVISFRSRAGGDLDDVHPQHPSLLHHPVDQLDHVMVEQSAGGGGVHRRHHRGVDAVGIDAQVVGASVRNAIENRLNAMLQHLVRGDDLRTVGERIVVLALPRAALRAEADLVDAVEPGQLGRAPDGIGVPLADTILLVAPVEMRIDMHQGDGTVPFAGPEHRNRHPMVAADADEQRTGIENLPRRRLRLAVVRTQVAGISGHVAAVDHPDVPPVEQRPPEVEVEPIEMHREAWRRRPDGGRRVGLIVRYLVDGVGITVGQAKDRDVRVEGVEIGVEREAEERRVRGAGEER